MSRDNQTFEPNEFDIEHRPTRTTHDTYQVTDDEGEPVTDKNGDPLMAGGGFTIDGYTMFNLTTDDYARDELDDIVATADEWGPYAVAKWEPYNYNFFDKTENCPFEVRILPDRVALDVKANTTSESLHQFAEELVSRTDADSEWHLERDGARISA